MITRSEWGARAPRWRVSLDESNLAGVCIHWFGSPTAVAGRDRQKAQLRAVQNYHMNEQGWFDIAYNFAVSPEGDIYELRGFGVQSGANGYAAANRSHAAVVYMAGRGDALTPEAIEAFRTILAEYRARGAGDDDKPHGYFTGSECPGPELENALAAGQLEPREVPEENERENEDTFYHFAAWRIIHKGVPEKRPEGLRRRIPLTWWARLARPWPLRIPSWYWAWQKWIDGGRSWRRPGSAPMPIPLWAWIRNYVHQHGR